MYSKFQDSLIQIVLQLARAFQNTFRASVLPYPPSQRLAFAVTNQNCLIITLFIFLAKTVLVTLNAKIKLVTGYYWHVFAVKMETTVFGGRRY